MRNSRKESELLDLERDLPTTAEDVRALRRFRDYPRLSLHEYLRFLNYFDPPTYQNLRSKKRPRSEAPFVLD